MNGAHLVHIPINVGCVSGADLFYLFFPVPSPFYFRVTLALSLCWSRSLPTLTRGKSKGGFWQTRAGSGPPLRCRLLLLLGSGRPLKASLTAGGRGPSREPEAGPGQGPGRRGSRNSQPGRQRKETGRWRRPLARGAPPTAPTRQDARLPRPPRAEGRRENRESLSHCPAPGPRLPAPPGSACPPRIVSEGTVLCR